MEKKTTKRQTNFELLRIICMLMIIGHHIALHGNFPNTENLCTNDYIIRFFTIGGKLGVNIFVLISGYFMICSVFRIRKLISLIAQALFYSLLIFLLFLIFGKVEYSNGLLLKSLFPISSNAWWFFSVYVIMYCLSPYLNILVKNCNKTLSLVLIIFLLTLQCIIQNVFMFNYLSNVGWFITLYLIAAYIRLYPNKILNSYKILLPVSLCTYILIAVVKVFANIDLWKMTEIVCVICSVSIFCTFKNFTIPNSRIINTVAKSTFGIYLVHDNELVRNFLWVDLLKCPLHYQFNTFICFALIAVVIVFITCMFVDFLRELLFISVNKIIKLITNKIKRKKSEIYTL